MNGIDITFDFRMDAGGKDPDSYSPTLKKYQQLLWSKALPNGKVFALDIKGYYLYHKSDLGEFCLSSDFVIPLFSRYTSMQSIIAQIPKSEIDDFFHIGYTIGGEMIWPANKIDNKMTINGARGFNRKISDRFDLTLECVRRFYRSEISPLFDDLARYKSFFDLFNDFKGYVDFFLLQDLVAEIIQASVSSCRLMDSNQAPDLAISKAISHTAKRRLNSYITGTRGYRSGTTRGANDATKSQPYFLRPVASIIDTVFSHFIYQYLSIRLSKFLSLGATHFLSSVPALIYLCGQRLYLRPPLISLMACS